MKAYRVTMICRTRGAIGIFERRWFDVLALDAGPFAAWQAAFSHAYEPYHLERAIEIDVPDEFTSREVTR